MGHYAGQRAARPNPQPSQPEAEHEDLECGEADRILDVQRREEDRGDDDAKPREEGPTKKSLPKARLSFEGLAKNV